MQEGLKAEAVLLLGIAIWRLRAQLVPLYFMTPVSRRRRCCVRGGCRTCRLCSGAPEIEGSALPRSNRGWRPILLTDGGQRAARGHIDRGIEGIRVARSARQRAVKTYVDIWLRATLGSAGRSAATTIDESMILGFSDLHCNQLMTELIAVSLVHGPSPLSC